MIEQSLLTRFDPVTASIEGQPMAEKKLSQLRDTFADRAAFERVLREQNDPVIYSVTSVAPGQGDGQLHFGIGKIMPGRIGSEYFMTRGHFHDWRLAAEIYIGLGGTGLMLLEDESGEVVRSLELLPDSVVYIPGETAHRTINTGSVPLIYMGIYPAAAGHDYGALATRNFSKVVIAQGETPVLKNRQDFLDTLA